MFPKRSHVLAPLTKLVGGRGRVKWTAECQQAFDQIKAILAKDAFLKYPDHNKPFHIYGDASDLQLGAVIMQDNTPVAYYSRKLNSAQRNYSIGEKEILSFVETLKEYRTMLYGFPNITVYTDHKNNTFRNLNTQRVLRWRLFLDDYGVHFGYIPGETNKLADALSRLPYNERQNPSTLYAASPDLNLDDDTGTQKPCTTQIPRQPRDPLDAEDSLQAFSTMADDDDLLDCFVHLPLTENVPFVLSFQDISQAQHGDARLQLLRERTPAEFQQHLLATDTNVWCYNPANAVRWKIYLPDALLVRAVRWYHLSLSHIGTSRLTDTMSMTFYHPKLRDTVEAVLKPCDECQRFKNVQRGHGHTAPREARLLPWSDIAVDLIGPWKLTIGNRTVEFRALTIIDLVTNLVELVRINSKTSREVTHAFVNTWLARYPKPVSCIYYQDLQRV